MSASLFGIAQQYAAIGYVCLPVNVTLDTLGKKRIEAPSGWKERTFNQPADWAGYSGIAVDCGRSGVVAVDIDVSGDKDGRAGLARAGVELPASAGVVTTQSGGQHVLYRTCSVPVRDSVSKLADDVDIRATGMLIVAPTQVADGRAYRWQSRPVAVADLPQFPEELARKLAGSDRVVTSVEYTPGDVSEAQRDWALRKLDTLLADIAEAGTGQRWAASGKLMRVFGIAKTLGEDLDAVAARAEAAYTGDEPEKFAGSIARAYRSSKPEDPTHWLPEDRERTFWDERPELSRIRRAAQAGMAAPWAVLGALLVRVLADVPPCYRLDTGIGSRAGGNLNLYSVLAAESGGGKGIATQVAEDLWPSEVYSVEVGSGEALPKLFAKRIKDPDTGEYRTERVRDSVIIDAPEFGSLSASAARQGATLIQRLCNGFSGEGLSFAVSDETKNVDVPKNSYRLGVVTGVQYGNAGLLLSDEAATTGVPQRFVWFPANVSADELPDVRPTPPASFTPPLLSPVETRIGVCDEAKRDMEAAQRAKLVGDTSSPLDGHRLYARVKVAYALAVLNGHYGSVRPEDWYLSGVVMDVSDAARQRAVDSLAAKSRKRAESVGKSEGIRKAAAAEAEADEMHLRVVAKVSEYGEGLTVSECRRRLSVPQRAYFDNHRQDVLTDARLSAHGGRLSSVAP